MEDLVDYFLRNPNGERYELLVAGIHKAGSQIVLSTLPDSERNQVLQAGLQTFGNEELFYRWAWTTLSSEHIKPIDILWGGDVTKVLDLLGRIRHSVYS